MRIGAVVFGFLALMLAAQTAAAFPPVFVLGTTGGSVLSEDDDDSSITATPTAGSHGSFSYRTTLPTGGYAAFGFDGSLRYYFGEVDDFQDQEVLSAEIKTPLGPGSLLAGAGATTSLQNLGVSGRYIQPDWSAGYEFPQWENGLPPEIRYSGLYRYEADGVQDKLRNAVAAGIVADPSIRFGYSVHAEGAWELFSEQKILDEDGTEGGAQRSDIIASLDARAEGLMGFFTSWNVDTDVGYRASTANRYIAATGEVEENSQSRLFARLEPSVEFSPVQQLGIGTSLTFGDSYYVDRAALGDDGRPSEANLNLFDIGGSVYLDWTPNNALFFLLEASVSRQFSSQPGLEGWSSTIQGGIEYSF